MTINQRIQRFIVVVLTVTAGSVFFSHCSTEKTGWAHRTFHNVNARFNGYFNAKELMRFDEIDLSETEDNYDEMLPVFKGSVEENRQPMLGDMETVIEKCTKVINYHSIEKRGKQYVKWIDNCYFLMGKANYYKSEYVEAHNFFDYVSKKFKNEDSQIPAMLWLARNNLERKRYEDAEKVMRLAESKPKITEEQLITLRLIYADLYIRQKNYLLAIPELRYAITKTKDKDSKARLTFLLGQLYQEVGEHQNASDKFKEVIEYNRDYRQVFYARIERAMSYSGGYGSSTVKDELNDMLVDEKYIEFRDQIYYALAEVALKEGDKEKGIELLKKSASVSQNNNKQKGKSFMKLAKLYFADLEYQNAQRYYDSTLAFISNDHPEYESTVKLSNNLNELVTQIDIIETQDSLLRVANMPEKERLSLLDDIIEARREKEREEEEFNTQNDFGQNQTAMNQGPKTPGMGGNKWYFYSPTAKGLGASEFKRIWGSRKNEDNWRRSDKSTVQVDFAKDESKSENDSAGVFVNASGDTVKASNDWEQYEYYLKDLPFSEEKKEAANDKIIDAYYELAIIYKEKLEDKLKSIETLEKLNSRFPDHKHLVGSYFRLYRMHESVGHSARSEEYKQKILNQFPDSDYAKVIKDPYYLERESELSKEAKKFYEKTYGYYNRELYLQTMRSSQKGIDLYSETVYGPKFELLHALAVGKEKGRKTMISELQTLSKKYDSTEIGKEAAELIAAVQSVEKREQEEKAAEARKEQQEKAKKNTTYNYNPGERHLFVVFLPTGGSANPRTLRIGISNFNRQNYKSSELELQPIQLKPDTQMVSVKDFESGEKAMTYYRTFSNDKIKLAMINQAELPRFVISYSNYATFYKRKDIQEYLKFFNKKYAEFL